MTVDLSAIRTDYARAGLTEADVDPSPVVQLRRWLDDALAASHPEPTAMTVATATRSGEPDARVVLLKGLDDRGLVFYTGHESQKGRELEENPRACANFFWVLLERQARVTGAVTRASREEAKAYFDSRPRGSRLAAWASAQSSVIHGRAELEARYEEVAARFGTGGDIPLPPHWGGYRIAVDKLELWQGRPSRLHDRLRYTRTPEGTWLLERLSP
ncbi:MAG: Pyridoxamine 5-phosphate oxidase [Labilithrix sp.]|nr:Pyridoxamine 5-phosphate oxidase [Labilithrix sp.]